MPPSLILFLRVRYKQLSLTRVRTQSFSMSNFFPQGNTKGKSIKNKGKDTDREFSKLTPIIKCYKCQGYGHVAANCPTPVKIALVNGEPEVVAESESEEFIFQGEEEESDMDDDTGDSIGLNCI